MDALLITIVRLFELKLKLYIQTNYNYKRIHIQVIKFLKRELIINNSLVSDKIRRIGLPVWIDHDDIRTVSVSFHTVVRNSRSIPIRRLSESLIRVKNFRVSNDYSRHEHLSLTCGQLRGIVMRIWTIVSEIVCSAPHSIICIVNIESFFTHVNCRWRSSAGTMKQLI